MRQFYLADIVTKDKLSLQGLYAEPKQKGKRAILWMHGLSSTFYNEGKFLEIIADAANKEGWGFAEFNSRGHDMIAGVRKMDGTPPYGYSYYSAGAGQEVFEESVMDIEAGIDFLVKQGYLQVILIGHSTGANKVCYYGATQKNPRVICVVLSGPMSDRLSPHARGKWYIVPLLKLLIALGRGNKLITEINFFPTTPKRLLSLLHPRSPEDVFDYGEPEPKLVTFSKIQLPLMVLLSGADEGADRPIAEIQKVFDSHAKAPKYKSVIIPNALHRYNGNEREAVAAIIDWVKTI